MPLSASEGLCVMVADDEPPARQRIIDLLRRDSRVAAIIEAFDGLSAVEVIQNRKPRSGVSRCADAGTQWAGGHR
jgi:two-component system LytT family response regulator